MTTALNIAKNTFFIAFSNIATKIIAFIITIYMARYLDVSDFGKYTFIISYLAIFGFITGFGLDPVIIRECSKNTSSIQRLTTNAIIIRIITALLSIFLAITIIKILKYPFDTVLYVQITSIVLLFQGLSYLIESLFQSQLKMEYSALSQIASKLLFGLFIYYIIQNDLGLEYIFMAYICSELIRTIISFIFSFHFTKYTFNISKNTIQYLVKQSLPFVFGYGLLMLYNRFDILLLSIIQGDIAVGFYSAAYRITESILFIPGALASTLMPIMAKQFVENKNKLVRTYIIGTRFIFMILFPITVGSVILSRDIITWIYTEKFLSSTIVFQILSLTIMFNSLISLQNSIFIAINKQRLNNIAILLCAVLNIALNIILIPKMSFTGAGLATLISVICLYLIGFHFVYKETGIQPFKKDILKYVFASLIMGISISIMEHDIVFKIIDGFLIYIAIIILLKGLNKEDIKMLRK